MHIIQIVSATKKKSRQLGGKMCLHGVFILTTNQVNQVTQENIKQHKIRGLQTTCSRSRFESRPATLCCISLHPTFLLKGQKILPATSQSYIRLSEKNVITCNWKIQEFWCPGWKNKTKQRTAIFFFFLNISFKHLNAAYVILVWIFIKKLHLDLIIQPNMESCLEEFWFSWQNLRTPIKCTGFHSLTQLIHIWNLRVWLTWCHHHRAQQLEQCSGGLTGCLEFGAGDCSSADSLEVCDDIRPVWL